MKQFKIERDFSEKKCINTYTWWAIRKSSQSIDFMQKTHQFCHTCHIFTHQRPSLYLCYNLAKSQNVMFSSLSNFERPPHQLAASFPWTWKPNSSWKSTLILSRYYHTSSSLTVTVSSKIPRFPCLPFLQFLTSGGFTWQLRFLGSFLSQQIIVGLGRDNLRLFNFLRLCESPQIFRFFLLFESWSRATILHPQWLSGEELPFLDDHSVVEVLFAQIQLEPSL